ncbi:MAG: nucleotide pyrophosphohydrolase [Firmicutes bacterium]|nr:nucleotide pyrophosphohydrolase [Bacillota bacterium]
MPANAPDSSNKSDSTDAETRLAKLKAEVAAFVAEKGFVDNPKDLSMSIAIESAELMEQFQWLTTEEAARVTKDPDLMDKIRTEFADVFIYCLGFANELGIDITSAVRRTLATNRRRHWPHEK